MNEKTLFAFLERQRKRALLEYLRAAFQQMNDRQRAAVFADAQPKAPARPRVTLPVDAAKIRREVGKFHSDSLAGKYHAPFMIDSKNFMHVPEETNAWCDRFAGIAKDVCRLTTSGQHAVAVRCFSVLYELLEAMESGDRNIVFAHELGSWLIPADEKTWLGAYLKSLAATLGPGEFAQTVAPMLRRDSQQSFAAEVYVSARRAATPEQRAALESERLRRGIRVESAEPRRGLRK